jgi:hypothetical protein
MPTFPLLIQVTVTAPTVGEIGDGDGASTMRRASVRLQASMLYGALTQSMCGRAQMASNEVSAELASSLRAKSRRASS